jgi:hypothetical protein
MITATTTIIGRSQNLRRKISLSLIICLSDVSLSVRVIALKNITETNPVQTESSKTAARGDPSLYMIIDKTALVRARPIAALKSLDVMTVQSAKKRRTTRRIIFISRALSIIFTASGMFRSA